MSSMMPTYIWLVIYGICTILFFAVAFWVIVRGGKDVWEMLSEARANSLKKNKAS